MSDIQDIYGLTPLQAGLLFQTLYAPGSQVYVSQSRYALTGNLDTSALRRIFDDAVRRHDVLRTAILWENLPEPVQVVLNDAELEWEELDWSERNPEQTAADVEQLCRLSRQRGFDLESPPLMRMQLIRISEECVELIWTWHHILLDGWSVSQLVAELFAAYDAVARCRNIAFPTRRPYRDYVAWLRDRDEHCARAYWTERLRNVRAATPCPVTGVESGELTSTLFHLTEAETRTIQEAARRNHLTLNTLAQAAWALILGRSSDRSDILFGGVVSGRPAELEGSREMLGLFIKTLPVRIQVQPDLSIRDWLSGIQNEQAGAREFDYVPLHLIHQWTQISPSQPLFESLFVFENFPAAAQGSGTEGTEARADVRVDRKAAVSYTNYPLTVSVGPGRELEIRFSFRRLDHRADENVRRLGMQMLALLNSMLQDASQRVCGLSAVMERAITGDKEQQRSRVMSERARILQRLLEKDNVERAANR